MKLKSVDILIMWCDNQRVIALANNPVYHAKTKHVELDIHFIREKVLAKQISICFVPSADHTSDIFTKALTYNQFYYLRSKLKVRPGLFNLKGDVRICFDEADTESKDCIV